MRREPEASVSEKLENLKNEIFPEMQIIISGGAHLLPEISLELKRFGIQTLQGYGITECSPLISVNRNQMNQPESVGVVVPGVELRFQEGEILVRGENVMLGYYKDEEMTREAMGDGWFHTGDLATIDAEGHVFIRGRIKNMLLSANGQNIYPEEIENKLNSMMMVSESVIIQRDNKLVGLVHPDMDAAKQLGFSIGDLGDVMEENRKQLNSLLPAFCKVSAIQIHEQEFEKTPKKSIKRYLYQNA